VLAVNTKFNPLGFEIVAEGTLTETLAHPREIFQSALRWGASRIFIGHNHPGGSIDPSPEDIKLTRQLLQASQIMGIPILDHIVVSGQQWTSLRTSSGLWEQFPTD
jgi:DNA repair protein RadC